MAAVNLQAAAQFIATASKIAARKGIELSTGSNFAEFENILSTQPERRSLAPLFDHRRSTIAPGAGFWITGRDSQGELVHTQAMRLLNFSGLTLADSLRVELQDYAPGGAVVIPEESTISISPGTHLITGKTGYHGELWLKGGKPDYRGSGLVAVLARLAMAMAMLHWTPNYLFGFMYSLAACKGLAAREGYMHLEPETLRWRIEGDSNPLEAWLVWMSRADINYLMTIDPSDLYQKLENDCARRRKPHRRRQAAAKPRSGAASAPNPRPRRRAASTKRVTSARNLSR